MTRLSSLVSAPNGIPYHVRDMVTDDEDCLARSITGWAQEYQRLKAGPFHGSLAEVCFGDAQLFVEQTSHALRQICTVPDGYVWFGLPMSETRCVRINGVAVQEGRIAVHRGGIDFELITPDQLRFWGIVVREQTLKDYARQFEREDWIETLLGRPVLCVDEEHKQEVQRLCSGMLRHQLENEGATLPRAMRESLADETLSALFSLIESRDTVTADRCGGRQRYRSVELVDAYVRASSDRLVTVSELCTALNISRRALQTSFQEVLGISPHAYIRAVSLNGVRRHLRSAESPYGSVQDAAAAFGFWHMSQFALDYREMFGERPSETLRRRHDDRMH